MSELIDHGLRHVADLLPELQRERPGQRFMLAVAIGGPSVGVQPTHIALGLVLLS
jgi:hypothetical protein